MASRQALPRFSGVADPGSSHYLPLLPFRWDLQAFAGFHSQASSTFSDTVDTVTPRAFKLGALLAAASLASAGVLQSQNAPSASVAAATAKPATAASVAAGLESRKPFAMFSESATRLREGIVERAREAIGTRYSLGASTLGKGFDCSGLVRYVMSAIDMVLPRTAQTQSQVGVEIPKDIAALEPGDVLTFGTGKRISHVGIYIGDGKMIHASTSQRRVIETSLTRRSSPLIRQWQGVRRYVIDAPMALNDSVLELLSPTVAVNDTLLGPLNPPG